LPKVILFEKKDRIATITMNRPEAYNTITVGMAKEVLEALGEVAADDEMRAVVITGAGGKAFCTGADIKEARERGTLQLEKRFLALTNEMINAIEDLPKPVIAAVNGYCLGGGYEIALACDFIIASEDASFGFPEIKLGVLPAAGGTQRLPRLIGKLKAKELLLLGERISAKEAERLGMVTKVVKKDELMNSASELAQRLAGMAPLAVRQIKTLVNEGTEMPLSEALHFADEAATWLLVSEDRKEGIKAFLEKRKAEFKAK
jgi:enoyl-CoA hydratase